MRMTASWFGSQGGTYRIQGCGAMNRAPMASSPRLFAPSVISAYPPNGRNKKLRIAVQALTPTSPIQGSCFRLQGLGSFLLYFAAGIAAEAIFFALYIAVTPHRDAPI